MDDQDVRRLEDQIAAASREGQLRLEIVLARIDGKLEALATSVNDIKNDSRTQIADLRTQVAQQGGETRNFIVGSAFVVFFGVLALLIGLKQVWIGGVQVGQTIPHAAELSSAASAPPQPAPR